MDWSAVFFAVALVLAGFEAVTSRSLLAGAIACIAAGLLVAKL